jgi:hypothetical protein
MFLVNRSVLGLHVPCKHKCTVTSCYKEHEATVPSSLQGTWSQNTPVFTRNMKSQYTCVYKEHEVTVHSCLQGTWSHSTLVFTRNIKSQYTRVYKEHEVTVHSCLQGTWSHSTLVFTRNMKSQYTCVYKEYCDFMFLVSTSVLWLHVPCKYKCTVTSCSL